MSGHAHYIEDYESFLRSRYYPSLPEGLVKYIGKINDVQNSAMALSGELEGLKKDTGSNASTEKAEVCLFKRIVAIAARINSIRDVTNDRSEFLCELHVARIQRRHETRMLDSLRNLEDIWKRVVDDAENVLEESRESLRGYMTQYLLRLDLGPLLDE